MKRILVAPLNWGLGHATRCIPIINALIDQQFEPIIASDGEALKLLRKTFPNLTSLELPSYNIRYASKAKHFKTKLLKDTPHILKTIKKEKNATKAILKEYQIEGIISDNRFGVRSKQLPSVFISHQLKVLSGNTTWLSTALHQQIILKFNECWVPDFENGPNLSGALGHETLEGLEQKYLGPLSRFKKKPLPLQYDLMVLLSGPEPQRSFLEEKLMKMLESYPKKCLLVKGKIEDEQYFSSEGNLSIYNYLSGSMLEDALNSSALILCRSGYTSIMDLAKLEKKVFFIPTPGQFEQEYLALKLKEDGIAPFATQDEFTLELLDTVNDYKGFKEMNIPNDFSTLFNLFKGK